GFTDPVATSTSEMSADGHSLAAGREVWTMAIVLPSGDQSTALFPPDSGTAPIENFGARRRLPSRRPSASGETATIQSRPGRSASSTTLASSFSFSRFWRSSVTGSGATYAIHLPSGDHAKSDTSDFEEVSRCASPPWRGRSQTLLKFGSPRLPRNAIVFPSGDQRGWPDEVSACV